MLGQVVATERMTLSGNASANFDLSSLDKGVYFLTVGNNQDERTFKVTIK
ncbi:MAG: T9SS C-terminal target domain-containing protein [Bacteroidetes bacterium]|nr:MAG: T9SS C-terminal target domain-containing protein [Bacteroidota bacterium]